MKIFIPVLFILILNATYAQERKIKTLPDLHGEMWLHAGYGEDIGHIYADMGSVASLAVDDVKDLDDEKLGFVDDPESGFLMISDSDGPCGCGWSVTVKACKKRNGSYVFLIRRHDYCLSSYRFGANVPLKEMMPKELSWKTFYRDGEIPDKENTFLYASVELLRYSDDVILTILPLPFGVRLKGSDTLVFNTYAEEIYNRHLHYFREALNQTPYDETFGSFPGKKQIFTKDELEQLKKAIGKHYSPDATSTVDDDLEYMYRIYREYLKIEAHRVILGWDNKGSLYIKGKRKLPVKGFIGFMKDNIYWIMRC